MGIQFTLERYDVQILGHIFQFIGQMEPVGRVLDYFNTGDRRTFPLYDVKICPITPGSPLAGITRPEIVVSSGELGLIYFLDPEYRQRLNVLKTSDRVIVYTPHAVLKGNFHRGVETRLGDVLDMMAGFFLPMTDVKIFPLTALPASFPQETDLLLVSRSFINLYHPE